MGENLPKEKGEERWVLPRRQVKQPKKGTTEPRDALAPQMSRTNKLVSEPRAKSQELSILNRQFLDHYDSTSCTLQINDLDCNAP